MRQLHGVYTMQAFNTCAARLEPVLQAEILKQGPVQFEMQTIL